MPESDAQTGAAGEGAIRTFICFDIPDSVKRRIGALQQEMRQTGAQVSWVRPENIHLTLKFLGDVPRSRIEVVREAVERAASSFSPFTIEVAGAGGFPSPRSPRVLWVGLSGIEGGLTELREAIESELARRNFPREHKKFSPHLTIGRIRSPQNASRVAEGLIARGFDPESFEANEVIVMRSDLNPRGAIYTPMARINLKSEI
jgi:2'-5' RNA ligase